MAHPLLSIVQVETDNRLNSSLYGPKSRLHSSVTQTDRRYHSSLDRPATDLTLNYPD